MSREDRYGVPKISKANTISLRARNSIALPSPQQTAKALNGEKIPFKILYFASRKYSDRPTFPLRVPTLACRGCTGNRAASLPGCLQPSGDCHWFVCGKL